MKRLSDAAYGYLARTSDKTISVGYRLMRDTGADVNSQAVRDARAKVIREAIDNCPKRYGQAVRDRLAKMLERLER